MSASSEISPALQDLLKDNIENLEDYNIEIEESKLKGDNFLGDIVFLSLKSKKDGTKTHYVIKQILESMQGMEFFKDVYAVEIRFYEKIWPVLEKFQAEKSVGFSKIAKYYGSKKIQGSEKLMMEDLRQNKFKLYDKTKPFDEKHYNLIFESYGIFHAISYAYRELFPEEFQELTKNLDINIDPENMSEQTKKQMEGFGKVMKQHLQNALDLTEEEGAKVVLEKHLENPMKYFHTESKYTGDTPVLTHGDCWSNNFMFKYNDQDEVIDMRFLDFQLTKLNSPVHDLAYCFYSGASKKILAKLYDFLKIYHDSFTQTLQKLECKPKKEYTYETLKSEWKQYSKMGFYMGLMLWRMKLVDKEHIPKIGDSFEQLSPVEENLKEVYEGVIRDLVEHVYENGFI